MPDALSPLASAIRAERARRNQRQDQAAEDLEVHVNTLASWEQGNLPRSRHLVRLADWLGIGGDQLVAWLAEQGGGAA